MASVEDYIDLGGALVCYIEANASHAALQNAFKDGGLLNDVLKTLDSQEAQLDHYQDSLLKSFDPKRSESLSLEQINQQIVKNDDERKEIILLRSSLNQLFDTISKSNSGFAKCKAISEFIKSVEQGKKVDVDFFSTLICTTKNIFTFVDKEELEETKLDLKATIETISDKQGDRIDIPSKEKVKKVESNEKIDYSKVQARATEIPAEIAIDRLEPSVKSQNDIEKVASPPLQTDTLSKEDDDIPMPPQQNAIDDIEGLPRPPLNDDIIDPIASSLNGGMDDLPPPPSDSESGAAIKPEPVKELKPKEVSNIDMMDDIPKPPQTPRDAIDNPISKVKEKVKRAAKPKQSQKGNKIK
jgi:hypothetical protein